MDLTPYADRLRSDLVTVTATATDDVREAAERIAASIDATLRLTLRGVLSEADRGLTTALPTGSVEVRLRGREAVFALDSPPPVAVSEPSEAAYAAPQAVGADTDDADVIRITVRLPETIKARAEELAIATGRSLNAWIVGAIRSATREAVPTTAPARSGHRLQGWI